MIRKSIVASGLVIAALVFVMDGAATDAQACGGCRSRCGSCYSGCGYGGYSGYGGCGYGGCGYGGCGYGGYGGCNTCYNSYAAPACCANVYGAPVYAFYASRPFYSAPIYAAPVATYVPRSTAVPVSNIRTRTVFAR